MKQCLACGAIILPKMKKADHPDGCGPIIETEKRLSMSDRSRVWAVRNRLHGRPSAYAGNPDVVMNSSVVGKAVSIKADRDRAGKEFVVEFLPSGNGMDYVYGAYNRGRPALFDLPKIGSMKFPQFAGVITHVSHSTSVGEATRAEITIRVVDDPSPEEHAA